MKPLVRNIIYIAASVIILVIAFAMFKVNRQSRNSVATSGDVNVSFSDGYQFLSEDQIKDIITKDYGPLVGQRIDSVKLSSIEAILDSNSAILKSEAYVKKDGSLNISIVQRKPVVRFQEANKTIYADNEGVVFPIQGEMGFETPIIDGTVPEQSSDWTKSMVSMVQWIQKSKLWAEKFVQIHSDKDGNITLIPREGRERILFGQPDNIESKFARLEDYYKCIVPTKDEGYYGSVNLQYDGQIVCRK